MRFFIKQRLIEKIRIDQQEVESNRDVIPDARQDKTMKTTGNMIYFFSKVNVQNCSAVRKHSSGIIFAV